MTALLHLKSPSPLPGFTIKEPRCFFRLIISFRKRHPILGSSRFWRDSVTWRGITSKPDRSRTSHSLAFSLREHEVSATYVTINAYWEDLVFELPDTHQWVRVVDRGLPSPADINPAGEEVAVSADRYRAAARSVVILEGRIRSSEIRGETRAGSRRD